MCKTITALLFVFLFSLPIVRIAYSQSWFPIGSGMNDEVNALAVYGGDLIAGGRFFNAGGKSIYHIAKWNGISWSPLGNRINGTSSVVFALTLYGNDLIAAGVFTTIGRDSMTNIANWNGTSWFPLGS